VLQGLEAFLRSSLYPASKPDKHHAVKSEE